MFQAATGVLVLVSGVSSPINRVIHCPNPILDIGFKWCPMWRILAFYVIKAGKVEPQAINTIKFTC